MSAPPKVEQLAVSGQFVGNSSVEAATDDSPDPPVVTFPLVSATPQERRGCSF
jgi:hypothetical protein